MNNQAPTSSDLLKLIKSNTGEQYSQNQGLGNQACQQNVNTLNQNPTGQSQGYNFPSNNIQSNPFNSLTNMGTDANIRNPFTSGLNNPSSLQLSYGQQNSGHQQGLFSDTSIQNNPFNTHNNTSGGSVYTQVNGQPNIGSATGSQAVSQINPLQGPIIGQNSSAGSQNTAQSAQYSPFGLIQPANQSNSMSNNVINGSGQIANNPNVIGQGFTSCNGTINSQQVPYGGSGYGIVNQQSMGAPFNNLPNMGQDNTGHISSQQQANYPRPGESVGLSGKVGVESTVRNIGSTSANSLTPLSFRQKSLRDIQSLLLEKLHLNVNAFRSEADKIYKKDEELTAALRDYDQIQRDISEERDRVAKLDESIEYQTAWVSEQIKKSRHDTSSVCNSVLKAVEEVEKISDEWMQFLDAELDNEVEILGLGNEIIELLRLVDEDICSI